MIRTILFSLLFGIFSRIAYVYHTLCYHDTQWTGPPWNLPPDVDPDSFCGHDIICHTCQEVIWCRGMDLWNLVWTVDDDDDEASV